MKDPRRRNISIDPKVWDAARLHVLKVSVEQRRVVSVSEFIQQLLEQAIEAEGETP